MRILVTGARGFVGSHIAEMLFDAEHELSILDDFSSNVNCLPMRVATALDREYLKHFGKSYKPEAIVHCAARADIAGNWPKKGGKRVRARMWEDNVELTRDLLEAFPGVPFVFLSTCAVYGAYGRPNENYPTQATSPYAASKIAAEALVEAYCAKDNTPHHILRLSCVVGARYHHGHISDFVHMLKAGAFNPKSDGYGAKSNVHVKDVARLVQACIEGDMPISNNESAIYDVGSSPWSPRDTARLMGLAPELWPPSLSTLGWQGDHMCVADDSKLLNTGFHYAHTVEEGVREALDHLDYHPIYAASSPHVRNILRTAT